MKDQKKYKKVFSRILVSLIASTIGLYVLVFSARYFGAEYNITHGEYFITWSLLSILVLLSINHVYKK